MGSGTSVKLAGELRQTQTLAPHMMQGLKLLAKSLPELRAEISAEMSRNPAIEDVDHPLETVLSEVSRRDDEVNREPDYPEDDFEPNRNYDEEAAERRQHFFDSQVKTETLQEHLLAQLPLSDIPQTEWPLVETLVGDLDDAGYYKGSLPDAEMVFGKTESEIVAVLAKIMEFDPPGCGARSVKECLLAQMDTLEDSPYEDDVRAIIEHHLGDLEAGRLQEIEKSLGLTAAQLMAALKELRSLDGRPGRQYASERDRIEYVNPEVHAVKRNGHWFAVTDERSLPDIRLSPAFARLLEDPAQSAETKTYVKERIAAAQAFKEAVSHRQKTVQSIAQAIFDRQQDFFEHGLKALKPLTEVEIAKIVGVHGTTVSRTVRDKYASTPKGTIELRRFFVTGVRTSDGETLSQDAVMDALRNIVTIEDKSAPLSDERISAMLKERGFPVARRTVAKYRDRLGIAGASARKRT
jgi:RNA polymerase sigma-54 factor